MATRSPFLALIAIPTLLAGGCAAEGGGDATTPDCSGDNCDDLDKPDGQVPDSPCDGKVVDKSGRKHKKVAGRLNDPFAKLAMMEGDDCPTTFAEIIAKLRETDKCNGGDGLATRAVSETAQIGGAGQFRLVTSKTCSGRAPHTLLFSLFGVSGDAASLPDDVEIIAFDDAAGVFNYYETAGGTINFFGNSKDMLTGTGSGGDKRCAGCHTGGGLIMKELHTPWLHWEGHMDTPGAAELIAKHPDLGVQFDGQEFERTVRTGNRAWNEKRIDHLLETASLKDVLRPLFCAVEVNLDSGSDFESPPAGGPGGDELGQIPGDALLDPMLGSAGVTVAFADYDARIKTNQQSIADVPGAIDTVFDFVFPERAESDVDWVQELIDRKFIDSEFAKDVLLVDFTRPLFSDDRCKLLELAPDLGKNDRSPKSITEGFVTKLGKPAEGTPQAALLANLKASGGHEAKTTAFVEACTALGSAPFLANVLAVTSLNRRTADALQVFEFDSTMPTDTQSVPTGTRLHPASCQLTTQFVAN